MDAASAGERIWRELHVKPDTAMHFVAIFARFEYALKRSKFLAGGRAATPDWNCFARSVARECDPGAIASVFAVAPYLRDKPSRVQIVKGDALAWDHRDPLGESASLADLLAVVRTTRNNLFHGGKFPMDPVDEPLRDARLLGESSQVLLTCLELDCDAARRVREMFWDLSAG